MATTAESPLIPSLPPDPRTPTYLNAAAVGLQSAETVRQVMHHAGLLARRGEAHLPALLKISEEARAALTRLLGAEPGDVAFVGSTSHGMDLFAQMGLSGRRRVVLCPEDEFPSSTLPWEGRGYEVRLVPAVEGAFPPEAFAPHLSDQVFAVVASAAQFATGTRAALGPLADAAHAHGALLIANVTQAVGIVPLSLAADGVDLAAGTGHKWLKAGFGNGFIYAPARTRERLPLPGMGWLSVEDPMKMRNHGVRRRADAAAVEYGAPDLLPRVALEAATRELEAVGMEAVFSHGRALALALREGAARRGISVRQAESPTLRGATVSLSVGDPEGRVAALKEAGVAVSARGGVRVSPHTYNCLADIEAFWAAWDRLP